MPRKMTISYTELLTESARQRPSAHAWYLATNTDAMQFYLFDAPADRESPMISELISTLDRTLLTAAGDKKTAANWAKRLDLKNWAYVRV